MGRAAFSPPPRESSPMLARVGNPLENPDPTPRDLPQVPRQSTEKGADMIVDSITLRAACLELAPLLEGGLLQKISQLDEQDLVLHFRRPGVTHRLLIRLAPDDARVVLVEGPLSPAREPSAFTMLMRKHLSGLPLLKVHQKGMERSVWLDFQGWSLVVEIPGRSNNIFLVAESGRLAGMLNPEREGSRRLRPGRDYAVPPRPDRPEALDISGADLPALLSPALGEPVARALARAVFGLPPQQCRLACRLAGLEPLAPLTREALEALAATWPDWNGRLEAGAFEAVRIPGGRVSPWPLGEPGEVRFSSVQEALREDSDPPGVRDERSALEGLVRRAQRKARTVLERRLEDLERARQADSLRLAGELLLAHCHEIPRGSDRVSLPDWEGRKHEISLDPSLSAAENAQRLFREYRRLQRAQKALEAPLARIRSELEFIDEVLLALQDASSAQELEEIRKLWLEERPGVSARPKRRMHAPSPGPRRFRHEGLAILVGRNPRQNEKLTLKVASRDDLWFHARNIPGAHVVLRTAGRIPTEETLRAAAVLAARFSQAGSATSVEVVCTPIHKVKKPPGTPPGKVIYRGERTLLVDPAARIEGLDTEDEPGAWS
jgi:predicted ribosome quality control (RQC) complex YloA/Tae2 family protein